MGKVKDRNLDAKNNSKCYTQMEEIREYLERREKGEAKRERETETNLGGS